MFTHSRAPSQTLKSALDRGFRANLPQSRSDSAPFDDRTAAIIAAVTLTSLGAGG